jgi:hypothetical protein
MIVPGYDDASTYSLLAAAGQALAADIKGDPATLARGLDRTYRMRPHLRIIGDAMAGVLTGAYDRLLVITPPQVGKSTLVAEWGALWWLSNRPTDDIIIASYGADLAEARSKGVQGRVAEYGAEFGLHQRRGSAAVGDWQLTSGGHLRAVGVGSGTTGWPANLIIVDDPHANRAEAESPRIRNATHEWWSSTASTRLQPDMGAVICIMTRWHEDDFAGRRLTEEGRKESGGRWKVVHLPALADPRFGPDPLGREPGEPLTHPKIPTRDRARRAEWWADKKRTSTVRDWHSLYQGDPRPVKGALVTGELLRLIRDTATVVEPNKIGIGVDPSGGGRDACGIIGGFLGADRRLWITDDRSGVMASAQWSRVVCELAYDIDASVVFFEPNFGGDMAALAIRSAWQLMQREGAIPDDELPPMVTDHTLRGVPLRARVGKVLRAEPIAQQMSMDKVRLRGIFPDLEREWTTWQPTDPLSPGRIDASVILGYGLLPLPAAGTQTGQAQGPMPATGASPLDRSGGASGFGPLGG